MNNLTETQKEAISDLVNWALDTDLTMLNEKAKRVKELFPAAFAEPKQERKKIVVEISYNEVPNSDNSEDEGLDAECINICLTNKGSRIIPKRNVEVKELPELYTAEDMIEFANYWHDGIGKYDEISESLKYWKEPKK